MYAEPIACLIALIVMRFRDQIRTYSYLAAFLFIRTVSTAVCIPLIFLSGKLINRHLAYQTYFYVYWISYALEAGLGLAIVYSVYRLAMAPLKGLQALGMLMFRWAAAIAVVVALGMAFGPRVTGIKFLVAAVSQLQQTQSILTLCMLLFVTFAIRPMGLSYRSKIFGVSLGLGVFAATDLICSGWLAASHIMMTSTLSLVTGLGVLLAICIWIAYFALPEPKRRIIVLPTTSPFLRWNQISQALGDNPGFVAIAGVPPEVLAPAELEIMRRASLKMAMELARR
jgi:hypothetical protein